MTLSRLPTMTAKIISSGLVISGLLYSPLLLAQEGDNPV